MPFTHLAIKKAFKGIRKRATGFILLALLFLIVGLLQYAFVNYQLRKTTTLGLNESTDEIANEIYKSDKWDLKSYEQADYPISSWYVLSSNGLLIDNEVPIPELLSFFHFVEFPTNLFTEGPHTILLSESPQTITSEVGGQYRLLARKILGGIVIVGMDIEEPTNNSCAECMDERLAINLAKFGTNLDTAIAVPTREINQDIS
jgi:hypothetical protein